MDDREHVRFEDLNDFVDGRLEEESSRSLWEHLTACHDCAEEYRRILELLDVARTVPTSVLPEVDIWPDLQKKIESRKTIVLPAVRSAHFHGESLPSSKTKWTSPPFLAVAALILIVLSSGITTVVLRRAQTVAIVPDVRPSTVVPPIDATPVLLPAGFRQTELEYNRTIQQLLLAMNAQRGQLAPATIATVEHSLTVIDSAITEARTALLADPNNRVLIDLLSANYQRKLDLLKRASELGSRI